MLTASMLIFYQSRQVDVFWWCPFGSRSSNIAIPSGHETGISGAWEWLAGKSIFQFSSEMITRECINLFTMRPHYSLVVNNVEFVATSNYDELCSWRVKQRFANTCWKCYGSQP